MSAAQGATALFLLLAGCAQNPAAKTISSPPVYVRLAVLEASHPLQASVQNLDALAVRLRADSGSEPAAILATTVSQITAPPPAVLSALAASDAVRNRFARTALLVNATETLRRYADALESAQQKIVAEKRAELEGIARIKSRAQIASARVRIDDETRAALLAGTDSSGQQSPLGRSFSHLNTQIKHDSAATNLNEGNVIAVARDDTGVRSKVVLQKQIVLLDTSPKATVSDEARLTKTRDELANLLDRFETDDADYIAAATIRFRHEVTRIRAANDALVEAQLADLPGGAQDRAILARLRKELIATLHAVVLPARAASDNPFSEPQTVAPLLAPAPMSLSFRARDAALRRIADERDKATRTIASDTITAVRDAAAIRHLTPVFVPSPAVPDRTADFRTWIFGSVRNVWQDSLSKDTKIPERAPAIIGTTREAR